MSNPIYLASYLLPLPPQLLVLTLLPLPIFGEQRTYYASDQLLSQGYCHADDEEAAEAQRKEEERLQDQKDKDEFQARMLARDDEKTRKLAERKIDPETLKVDSHNCCTLM